MSAIPNSGDNLIQVPIVKKDFRKRAAEVLEVSLERDPISRIIDIALMLLIILNVIAITLESVPELLDNYRQGFYWFDVFSVIVFTIEYLIRIWSSIDLEEVDSDRPIAGRLKYMLTPMVLIDLIAIIPFYMGFFISWDLRFLRVIRLLRIFKLTRYSAAMNTMLSVFREEASALGAATFVLCILLVLASCGIHLIEHELQPEAFGSIPASMWWSIVTLTTVGYGDVTPLTVGGKMFGAAISLIGVGMVALPTAILASGFANAFRRRRMTFEQEIELAMEDGKLTLAETETLKQIQLELGVSKEDAEHILRITASRLHMDQPETSICPHCHSARNR